MKLNALLTLKTAGLKAETANARIKSFEEKENNFVTKKFSPCYGDRKLKTQKKFFKIAWSRANRHKFDKGMPYAAGKIRFGNNRSGENN